MKQLTILGVLALAFGSSAFAGSTPLPQANSGMVTVLSGQTAMLNMFNYDAPATSCKFIVTFLDSTGAVMESPFAVELLGGTSATSYVSGTNTAVRINIDFTPQLAANASKLDPLDGCYRLIPTFEVFDPTLGSKVVDPIFVGIPSAKPGDKVTKVEVCHKPGTPAQKTMTLPLAAIPGHLGHGDSLGVCH